MNTQITVKIQGVEVLALQSSDAPNASIYVPCKEIAKVARAMIKKMGLKASVRKSSAGSLQVRLPAGTTQETRTEVSKSLSCLEGTSFDGMIDLASCINRSTDDNRKCLFGSKYVFVDIG